MSKRRDDPQREIARRARRYANNSCDRCRGRGTMGRFIAPDGSTQLLVCKCAFAGFPELQRRIKIPDGKRNAPPR